MKKVLVKLIRFYQKNISSTKPARCRFYPTCSQYAIDAINNYGTIIGLILFLFRLCRCNPIFSGGYDPVPEKLFFIKKRSKK